jgi:hypothetical protein
MRIQSFGGTITTGLVTNGDAKLLTSVRVERTQTPQTPQTPQTSTALPTELTQGGEQTRPTHDRTGTTWRNKRQDYKVTWNHGQMQDAPGQVSYAAPSAKPMDQTLLAPTYNGSYKATFGASPGMNFGDYPSALQASINAKAQANYANVAYRGTGFNNEYDERTWTDIRWGVKADGNYQLQPGVGTTGDITFTDGQGNVQNMGPGYGGPGLWCGRGVHIPAKVDTPYGGASVPFDPPTTKTGQEGAAATLQQRMAQVLATVPYTIVHKGSEIGDNCSGFAGIHQYDSEQLPIAVQPNGGLQVACEVNLNDKIGKGSDNQHTRRAIYVMYLDPRLTKVGEFLVEALHVGGMVAIGDTGTAMLMSQKQCEATSINKHFQDLHKAVVAYWNNGALVWAKQLTDVYKGRSFPEFETDPNGAGDYIENDFTFWSQMQYDAPSQTIRVIFPQTGGRGGHQGCSFYKLSIEGRVVYETPTCSHCWGTRLLPRRAGADGSQSGGGGLHSVLCLDDGVGIKRVADGQQGAANASVLYNTRTEGEFAKCASWYGNTARLLNAVARPREGGYFVTVTTRACTAELETGMDESFPPTEKNRLRLLRLNADTTLNKVHDIPTALEPFHCHLVPYGNDPARETYLLYYVGFANCDAVSNVYIWGPREGQPVSEPKYMYQIVEFRDDRFVVVKEAANVNAKMHTQTDPVHMPATGDLLWASYFRETSASPWKIMFTHLKNGPPA